MDISNPVVVTTSNDEHHERDEKDTQPDRYLFNVARVACSA